MASDFAGALHQRRASDRPSSFVPVTGEGAPLRERLELGRAT
jgi:hypothetical protein